MLESERINICKGLAAAYHRGQYDKGGHPYIEHCIAVAEKMDDELSTCIALMHDILEDTECTTTDLFRMGFGTDIIYIVVMLTRQKDETYRQYIKRIGSDEIARKVKIADLEHNMDLSRLSDITPRDQERIEKRYKPALEYLRGLD